MYNDFSELLHLKILLFFSFSTDYEMIIVKNYITVNDNYNRF